jgi:AcrR family transcriptional regulator
VKSDDKRDALLDSMADFVLTHGLSAASLRPLAKAAGLSDRIISRIRTT